MHAKHVKNVSRLKKKKTESRKIFMEINVLEKITWNLGSNLTDFLWHNTDTFRFHPPVYVYLIPNRLYFLEILYMLDI